MTGFPVLLSFGILTWALSAIARFVLLLWVSIPLSPISATSIVSVVPVVAPLLVAVAVFIALVAAFVFALPGILAGIVLLISVSLFLSIALLISLLLVPLLRFALPRLLASLRRTPWSMDRSPHVGVGVSWG